MTFHIDPYQHTLQKTVSCCGVGLHSGRTVNLSIKPAPENSGIRFFRTDIQPAEYIQAHMDMVVDTRLATTIGNDRIQISTTEHLLAALKAFGVDNAYIELDSREVPIMDGSAEPFFQLIKSSGKKKTYISHLRALTRSLATWMTSRETLTSHYCLILYSLLQLHGCAKQQQRTKQQPFSCRKRRHYISSLFTCAF